MKLFFLALVSLTSILSQASELNVSACSTSISDLTRKEFKPLKRDTYNGYNIVKTNSAFKLSVSTTGNVCGRSGGLLFVEYTATLSHSSGFKTTYKFCDNYDLKEGIHQIASENAEILKRAGNAKNVREYQTIMSEYRNELDTNVPAQPAKNVYEKALSRVASCEKLLGLDN